MKVLMLCYEFPPIGGGASRVVSGLTRELVSIGYEIDLVTMGFRGLPRYEKIGNINIYRVPCIRLNRSFCTIFEAAIYTVSCFFYTLKLLKRNKYQLNHTHFIFPDGFISFLIFKLTRLPYIITAHGSDVPGYNPDRLKLAHRLLFPIWKIILHHAKEIICPSSSLRLLIMKAFSKARVIIVPNGIDIEKFKPDKDKQIHILMVSRMVKRKGIQYFLKALEEIKLNNNEIHIVGDGPYLKDLKKMASPLGNSVKFWGWLDNRSEKLKELYETSSIFVFPSEAENFPIVLLEAMSAGLAIITTKGTGCAEVVKDCALLVDPHNPEAIRDALNTLIHNDQLRRHLGSAARIRLENNFSWQAVARQYARIYEQSVRVP